MESSKEMKMSDLQLQIQEMLESERYTFTEIARYLEIPTSWVLEVAKAMSEDLIR